MSLNPTHWSFKIWQYVVVSQDSLWAISQFTMFGCHFGAVTQFPFCTTQWIIMSLDQQCAFCLILQYVCYIVIFPASKHKESFSESVVALEKTSISLWQPSVTDQHSPPMVFVFLTAHSNKAPADRGPPPDTPSKAKKSGEHAEVVGVASDTNKANRQRDLSRWLLSEHFT